jgi:ADP-ribosyltransferase exoenzyme
MSLLVDRLNDGFQDWARSLAEDEVEALRYYQGRNHQIINRLLRDPESAEDLTENQSYVLRNITRLVDSAVAKGSMPFDLRVYRGLRSYEALFDGLDPEEIPGRVIHDPAFVSTSVEAHRAERFMDKDNGFRLEFDVPMNYQAAWMPLVGLDTMTGQKELLLPRDIEIQIRAASTREAIVYVEGVVLR